MWLFLKLALYTAKMLFMKPVRNCLAVYERAVLIGMLYGKQCLTTVYFVFLLLLERETFYSMFIGHLYFSFCKFPVDINSSLIINLVFQTQNKRTCCPMWWHTQPRGQFLIKGIKRPSESSNCRPKCISDERKGQGSFGN